MEKHEKRPRSYGASAYPEDIRVLAQKNAAQGKRLNLLQDVVFKDVFSADDDDSRKALKRLISVCIHREVADVRVLNSEISPEFVTGKTVRFDVHLDFNDGETADLEMQMGPGDNDIPSRATFYAVRLFSGQAGKGADYKTLKRSYQIFFLNKELFPNSSLFPRRYHMAEDTEHDQLSDLIEIQLYELPKMERKAQAILEGREEAKSLLPEEIWGIYFKYHQDEGKVGLIKELTREDEGLMSTERVLERVSRDREEWARALSRELGEMTYRSDINNARKEGYKQAEAEIQTARQQAEEYRRQLEEAQAKLHEAGL